jgi:hypothetical protein
MANRELYSVLASLVAARANCAKSGNAEWFAKHTSRAESIVNDFLPSGSGWDNGTTIDLERSTSNRLVFTGSYHHMDESGGYDGWTDHTVTVVPDLCSGFTLTISGRNRNDIKDYLADLFIGAFSDQIEYDGATDRYVSCVPQAR